jgi:perosamine synthetase
MLEDDLGIYFESPANNIHLFWKGRVGLYSILSALEIKKGDEVIIPAFTCVVVANAIIYHGAKPIYVDINQSNLQFEEDQLRAAINGKTKLIILQNTFGIPPDYKTAEKISKSYSIPCIEDCTHGLGTLYEGEKVPPEFIKASFYSFQWNKPLSAGLGGAVLCRDEALNNKLKKLNTKLSAPSFKEALSLQVLLLIRPIMNLPSLYPVLLRLFRYLSSVGLVLGSSASSELNSLKMPDGYFKGMSAVQKRRISKSLRKLDQVIKYRQANYNSFESLFKSLNLYALELEGISHSALKFPVLVKDKQQFKIKAEQNGIKLGDWMNSPIHPVEEDFEKWAYTYGQCSNAEYISRHIYNLQTDLTTSEMKRTISFVKENRSLFISA